MTCESERVYVLRCDEPGCEARTPDRRVVLGSRHMEWTLRGLERKNGWAYSLGHDYCPEHAEKVLRWRDPDDPTLKRTATLVARFWAKVDKRGPDECWLWTGMHRSGGMTSYGVIRIGGHGTKTEYAHRLAWEIANGKSIPRGGFICHHCDKPACVNPSHLFLGDIAANSRDMWQKGRGVSNLRRAAT
jgi:hypothetical protein